MIIKFWERKLFPSFDYLSANRMKLITKKIECKMESKKCWRKRNNHEKVKNIFTFCLKWKEVKVTFHDISFLPYHEMLINANNLQSSLIRWKNMKNFKLASWKHVRTVWLEHLWKEEKVKSVFSLSMKLNDYFIAITWFNSWKEANLK